MIANIAQGINTTVTNLLLFLTYQKIYKPKYSSKPLYLVTFILTTILYLTINDLAVYLKAPFINTVYSFFYFNILCLLLFKSSLKKSFMYNSLYLLLLIFVDVLSVSFWSIIKGGGLNNILSSDQNLTISYITNILIMILIWQIFILLISKNDLTVIKLKQIILLGAFTAFAAFVEYNFTIRIRNGKDGMITICIISGFIFISIFIVYFIGEITKAYTSKIESDLIQAQCKMQFDNYQEINKKYEESRKVIHDIKKHLSVLDSLNNADNNGKSMEYKRIIEEQVDSLFVGFQCSNQILSIIMSQKIMMAESKNIIIDTQIQDISFDFINDIDITAIFANLWDNAIESCLKMELTKRYIKVIIGRVNDYIVVDFENSFDGIIREEDNSILSTKKNHDGLGLTIIRTTIEKYHGSFITDFNNSIFQAKALIPIA